VHQTRRGARRLAGLLILLAAAANAASAPEHATLVLSARDGTRLFSVPILAGERFSIAFTHSLALSPVEEVFEAMPGRRFRLVETRYADFGAGLPHEEMPGQTMRFGDGRIILNGYTAEFADLWLRVGHIADHRLITPAGETVHLKDLARPGTAVGIRVE
jgi:hypothetical protein